MGKINGCLKCLFVFFNVLFAIFGGVLCYAAFRLTIFSAMFWSVGVPGVGWLWVIAIGILGTSCLGIYAGISEKELALKIFAGVMGAGVIFMVIIGSIFAVYRNQIMGALSSSSSEFFESYIKSNTSRDSLEENQIMNHCCGLGSASDWGTEIPQSCKCETFAGLGEGTGSGCTSRPAGTTGPDKIYRQTCGDIIFRPLDFVFKILMGIFFTFASTALLGLLTSLLMVYQVRRHDGSGGSSIAMKGY